MSIKDSRVSLGLFSVVACFFLGVLFHLHYSLPSALAASSGPTYSVVEELVTLSASAVTTLVPSGSRGYFIQPQTADRSIRVGVGDGSEVNSTSKGIVVNYLEALAEQVETNARFHSVRAISTGGNVSVWVVYYQ